MIKTDGFDTFLARLHERILILKEMLEKFDDGRSKSFYCTTVALLPASALHAALSGVSAIEGGIKSKAKALRAILTEYAKAENVDLKLTK